jgi:hypothetical protein
MSSPQNIRQSFFHGKFAHSAAADFAHEIPSASFFLSSVHPGELLVVVALQFLGEGEVQLSLLELGLGSFWR